MLEGDGGEYDNGGCGTSNGSVKNRKLLNMNITVTVTLAPEVLTLVEKFVSNMTPATKETAKSSKKKDEGKPEGEDQTSVGDLKPEPAAEAKVEKKESPITIEKVRAAVQEKAQAGKKEDIKKLLVAFKAENVTSLQSDQYNEFLSKVVAL